MKRRGWRWIGIMLGIGATYKIVVSLISLMGVSPGHRPAKAPAPTQPNFGAYPLTLVEPVDGEVSWYDPAKQAQRVKEAKEAPRALLRRTLAERKGDAHQTMMDLVEKKHDPDAAQALFEAMRSLSIQGSELETSRSAKEGSGGGEVVQPLIKAPEGEPGIRAVANVAERLSKRLGTSEEGRFDGLLLGESIRLMGFHGAPQVPEGQRRPTVDGKGKAAPIDPVVRGLLRACLNQGGELQALGSKALGQLGDLETAKELIQNPKKYPAASISDFGPEAVALFKSAQMETLKGGHGESDAEFWQGMRLSYRDRDTALALAMSGHGGAALAMDRHISMEYANQKDPDAWMAANIDTALRFPHTPASFKALRSIWSDTAGIGNMLDNPKRYPKSSAMWLRAVEHDLSVVFSGKPWKKEDVWFGNHGHTLGLMEHRRRYQPVWETYIGRDRFYEGLRAVYLQARKSGKVHLPTRSEAERAGRPTQEDRFDRVWQILKDLSLYGRHLGLEPIDWPEKVKDIEFWASSGSRDSKNIAESSMKLWFNYKRGMTVREFLEKAPSPWMDEGICTEAGHIRNYLDW